MLQRQGCLFKVCPVIWGRYGTGRFYPARCRWPPVRRCLPL